MNVRPAAGTWARTSKAAALDGRLPAEAFRILGIVAGYADGTCRCFPSVGRIADAAGILPRQVRRHLRLLEDLGYLRRFKRKRDGAGGGFTSNTYVLLYPPVDASNASAGVQRTLLLDDDAPMVSPKDTMRDEPEMPSGDSTILSSEDTPIVSPDDTLTNPPNKPMGNEGVSRARDAPPTSKGEEGKRPIKRDWRPDAETESWACQSLKLTREQLEMQIVRFVGWQQDRDRSSANWDGTFRAWLAHPLYQPTGETHGNGVIHPDGTRVIGGEMLTGRDGCDAGDGMDLAARVYLAGRARGP